MSDRLLYLDPDSRLSLQAQIRHRLVEAIHLGVFKPGARLPSSRELAEQLGVARNTVVLACQQLVAEGLLTGRPRSGLYVAQRVAAPAIRRRRRANGRHHRALAAVAQGACQPGHGTHRAGRRAQLSVLLPGGPVRRLAVSGERVARGLSLRARQQRHRRLVRCGGRARRPAADRGTAQQDPADARHQRARRRDPDHRRCAAGALPARRTAGRFERLGGHRGAGLSGDAPPRESARRAGRAPADRRRRPAGRQHARRLPHRLRHAEPPGRDRRDDVAGPSTRAAREGGAARHARSSRTTSTARATTRAIRTRRCVAWTARTA